MIRELLRQGLAVSEIARRAGRDRKTVRKVRDQVGHPPPQRRPPRGSILDAYTPYLRERAAVGVLNAVKLHREIAQRGYPGGVTLVRQFVRWLRPTLPRVVERFETLPGQQAQVDWASCGFLWQGGRLQRLSAFLFTLGYSRRPYVEFTLSQDQLTFFRCHVHAFQHFGGIPQELLYDNLKAAVDHRDAVGEVSWNRRFRDFADYYGFLPRACQPYRAQTKGKVENGVRYLRGDFLLGKDLTGMSLDGLNGQVQAWVRTIADRRVHGTTHERPIDRWEQEAAALRPLAGQPDYDTRTVVLRHVSREAFISYLGSRYAVPPEHAGKTVTVKVGADRLLQVYLSQDCVATHPVADQPGSVVRLPGHAAAVRVLARRRLEGSLPEPLQPLELPAWPPVTVRPLTDYDAALGLLPIGR